MFRFLASRSGRFLASDEGLTTVEYAAIIALVAGVLIVGATALGLGVAGVFDGAGPAAQTSSQ